MMQLHDKIQLLQVQVRDIARVGNNGFAQPTNYLLVCDHAMSISWETKVLFNIGLLISSSNSLTSLGVSCSLSTCVDE